MKKIIKILGIVLLLLITFAFLFPILYKKEIIQLIKSKSSEQINGKLEFSDLDISLIRHFPKLNIKLLNPYIDSYVNDDTSRLFEAKDLSVNLDLWNVFSKKERLDIKGFFLNDANILIKSYPNLKSNLDLLKDTSSSSKSEEGNFLRISQYEINHANIIYIDSASFMSIKNLTHHGQIDLNGNLADIETETQIDSLSLSNSGLSYLTKVKVNALLNLSYDLAAKRYLIKKNELSLNELKLLVEGEVKMPNADSYDLDLKIKSPNNQFKELFSLIPSAYKSDYKNVKSEGSFDLEGWTKGIFNSSLKQYPNWEFTCNVLDGGIQYNGMPAKLDQVNLKLFTSNHSPNMSDMNLIVDPFHLKLNNNPIEGRIHIDRVKSDPHVVTKLKGNINLTDFRNFMPLEKGTELSGIIDVNLDADFVESQVKANKLDQIKLDGFLKMKDILYKDPTMPGVNISEGDIIFNPNLCSINNVKMNLGKSDMSIQGNISNPLSIVNDNSTINGDFAIKGGLLDANEWLTKEDPANVVVQKPSSVPGYSKRSNITVNSHFDKVNYDTYKMNDVNVQGLLKSDNLRLNSFKLNINSNDMNGTADLQSIMDYVFNDKTLAGKINLSSETFDMNKFMASDVNTTGMTAEQEPFLVPKGMNLNIVFAGKKFIYDKVNLQDLRANLTVIDDEIQIKDLSSNALGGQMALSGIYNTLNPTKPVFDMKYDLRKIHFPKIFESIKIFSILAPIAKFIEGQFNSSFVFSGALSKGMTPDLSSLNLAGIIETIDAAIKNYKPLEAISAKLNIKELKNLSLKNSKNWFTVENGQVNVKDLKYKLSDIDIDINGFSKIQGPMDYNLKFRIPRSKINKNVIGQTAETGLNYLKSLGSKIGVNVEQGSHINVMVSLTGKLLDPSIKFKLLGPDGQSLENEGKDLVKQAVDKAKDSLRKRAENEVDKAKEKAMKEVNRIEDSIRKVAA
ncbi:MAG: AsmA-like C-terminal region-containing protein, partial [Saprospiraceae bacterium]